VTNLTPSHITRDQHTSTTRKILKSICQTLCGGMECLHAAPQLQLYAYTLVMAARATPARAGQISTGALKLQVLENASMEK